MASSSWRGYISFGLVSVPIKLYPAARYSHVAFHEIHRKCGHRVHQQLYCPFDKEVVSREDIALGYEVAEDRYVLVEPEELKALQPKSSTAMEILQFVKLIEIDPIYYETSHFAVPEEAGARAYALLLDTMEKMSYAAIAKVTLHQRERTVIIRPFRNGLTVHSIYYPSEIREAKGYGKSTATKLTKPELDLSRQFAAALVKPFRPEQYRDEYSLRVEQLIESKHNGKAAPQPEKAPRLAPVVDLMDALKKSLAAGRQAGVAAASKTKPRKLKRTA